MKALYRKYRPTSISEVIGQPQVTKPLSAALKSGRFSHSYLFTGPRGCGKTSVARIFAHEVNHFKYEIEDSYTDIIEIDAASNTGVDNIRELREKAAIAPSTGKYKVYIIDEVHMLSKSAFNALLKTLEEPPKHVIFIMATTDAYKVPITITSRAQVYNFQLATPDVMLDHLKSIAKKENIKIDDDALSIIVSRGGGSFRDSISLLDQISTLSTGETITKSTVESALGLPEEATYNTLLEAYEKGDIEAISEKLKNVLNSGIKPEILAENLIKKIITAPRPELLPLLKRLPSVSSPFAEAKILLAFLEDQITPTRPPVFAPTKSATPIPAPASAPTSAPAKPSAAPEASIAPAPTPVPEQTATDFSWETYIESIKNVNLGIASTLAKCTHKQEGSTLYIITERKIHKTILSSKNNLAVLHKFLPSGITLEIGNSTEIAKSSPELSQISDIMGDITEVKSDGVPF